MDLSGKTALVTGAGRRVGRAIALELASAGCDVVVHYYRGEAEARVVADEIKAFGRRVVTIQGDLAEPGVPQRLADETVDTLGRLDVLVNNAAVFDSVALDDWTDRHWERMFRLNAIAPAMLARAAATVMRQTGTGRIVNLADIMADRPVRGLAAYCASKAALVSITRSLARELAPQITVNAIAPGIAVFPESYEQEVRDNLVRRVPLQRAGSPEEIAAIVRFLVSTGDYITGQVIAVDGGRSIVP